MTYKLGVIGIGHWFKRLHTGVQRVGGLEVTKALGTRPYEAKIDLMKRFNITKEMYYTVDKMTGTIPEEFFDGVDVVQIADPNTYHSAQAIATVSRGKKAVVEKSFAANQQEYERFVGYLKDSKKENDVYLHLHYIDKMPTQELKAEAPGLISKFGRLKEIHCTFFESANQDEASRTWLFAPENGGLFMDWIHPMEVMYYAFGPTFGNIIQANSYATNLAYDKKNPTGLNVSLNLSGANFTSDAIAHINIAKGVDKRYDKKSMRFIFESGDYLRLNYVGSEAEFTSSARGEVEMGKAKNGVFVYTSSRMLVGENSSDAFVREIIKHCEGNRPGFNLDQIAELFKPQWEYQSLVGKVPLEKDKKKIEKFLVDGLRYG